MTPVTDKVNSFSEKVYSVTDKVNSVAEKVYSVTDKVNSVAEKVLSGPRLALFATNKGPLVLSKTLFVPPGAFSDRVPDFKNDIRN